MTDRTMKTVIETRPINLMVCYDDIIDVISVQCKLNMSGDIDIYKQYYPIIQRRVQVFFDELHGSLCTAISHPISKIIGISDEDDDDIDDIVNKTVEENIDEDNISEDEMELINKEIQNQIMQSLKTEKFINIPMMEIPVPYPTDSVISCLLYEKFASLLEIFDLESVEFTSFDINSGNKNTFIIDQRTSDMLVGKIFENYKNKIQEFFNQVEGLTDETVWWERVDMSVGDMWRLENEEYDELFDPLIVKASESEDEVETEKVDDSEIEEKDQEQKPKSKSKTSKKPKDEPDNSDDSPDIIEVD